MTAGRPRADHRRDDRAVRPDRTAAADRDGEPADSAAAAFPAPGGAAAERGDAVVHRTVLQGVGVAAVLLVVAAGWGCGTPAEEAPEARPVVRIASVDWAESVAMTHLAAAVMEDRLRLRVEPVPDGVAAVFAAGATGRADPFLDAWLPDTHHEYMTAHEGRLVDLGANFVGARTGLVVPD